MSIPQTPVDLTNELDRDVARRIGYAWREIRRGASMAEIRDRIFGRGGSALDPGQLDALDLIVPVESVCMGDLAEAMYIDPSTATRAVQRLTKDGLVERVTHDGDGRMIRIAATEKGRLLHAKATERRLEVMRGIMDQFDAEERLELASFLERFKIALDNVAKSKISSKK